MSYGWDVLDRMTGSDVENFALAADQGAGFVLCLKQDDPAHPLLGTQVQAQLLMESDE